MTLAVHAQVWFRRQSTGLARYRRRTYENDASDAALGSYETVDMRLQAMPTAPRTPHAPNTPSIIRRAPHCPRYLPERMRVNACAQAETCAHKGLPTEIMQIYTMSPKRTNHTYDSTLKSRLVIAGRADVLRTRILAISGDRNRTRNQTTLLGFTTTWFRRKCMFSKSHLSFLQPQILMHFLAARAVFANSRSSIRERRTQQRICLFILCNKNDTVRAIDLVLSLHKDR